MTNEADHLSTEALSVYLDHEASDRERMSVAAHLESCAGCRSRLEELQQLTRSLQQLPIPPAPAQLRTRIERALAPRREWLRWAYAAAAVVAGVAVMLLLFDRRSEISQPPAEPVTEPVTEYDGSSRPAPPPEFDAPVPAPAPPRDAKAIEQPAAKKHRQEESLDVIEQSTPSGLRQQADEHLGDTAAAAPHTAKNEVLAEVEKRRAEPCVMLPTTFVVRSRAGATGFTRWFEKRTGFAPQVETFAELDGYTYRVPRAVWERYKGEPLTGLDPEVQCVRFRMQLTP
jgi:hypothetical protein